MAVKQIIFSLSFVVMITLFAMSIALQNDAHAKNLITINIHDSVIAQDHRLFVHGMIFTNDQFYKPIILTMYDSTGSIIYEPRLSIQDNEDFSTVFTPTIGNFEIGSYSIHASHPSVDNPAIVEFQVVDDVIVY